MGTERIEITELEMKEWIKELEEKWWNSLRITNLPDTKEVRQLIRIVAAEARKEGIEEMREALHKSSPFAATQNMIDEEEARRLKEILK